MLERGTISALTLAYDCWEEALIVQPHAIQRLEEVLKKGLGSEDPMISKLAAEVKLLRRLNRLTRIADSVELDEDSITCGEYQLFVKEEEEIGRCRQPDHWGSEKLKPAKGDSPITGVRAKDAEDFCVWLTQRHSQPGVSYRLPTIIEVEEHRALGEVMAWCKGSQGYALGGIEPETVQGWQARITDVVIDDFTRLSNRLRKRRAIYRVFKQATVGESVKTEIASNPRLISILMGNFGIRELAALDPSSHLEQAAKAARDLIREESVPIDMGSNLGRLLEAAIAAVRDIDFGIKIRTCRQDDDFSRDRLQAQMVYVVWQSLFGAYSQVAGSGEQLTAHVRKAIKNLEQECVESKRRVFETYVMLAIIDERRKGNLGSWEGIRIARESADE
jgi:hypothetical protein